MTKIKIGVIGTGHLGKLHTKMLLQSPLAEFVGIYDVDNSKAEECSKLYNVNAYSSIDDLLNNVNAVSIAATTSVHFDLAKKCFENGIHVFIEKPITKTIEEAKELIELAENKNLKLQIGHIERFNPALLASEKYIDNPMFIQCDRLAQFNPRGTDVAVVLDLMIHDIDIILSLVKSEVKEVYASGVNVVSDSLDIANARIEFENGAVANVTASRISQKRMRKMRLFQKDAYISLDFNSGVSEIFRLIPSAEKVDTPFMSFGEIGIGDKKKNVIYEQPPIVEVNALQYELDLFLSCIQNDTVPAVSGIDGLRALKVADIIIQEINDSQKSQIYFRGS